MLNIPVITATVRTGNRSIRAANYLIDRLEKRTDIKSELFDIETYGFPVFTERFSNLSAPPQGLIDFREKILAADGIIIVAPEYNGGYPGALKNLLDTLYKEYTRKPVGLGIVSAGFGGMSCMAQLRQVCYSLGTFAVPNAFYVKQINSVFAETGELLDPSYEARAERFIDEIAFYASAIKNQQALTEG